MANRGLLGGARGPRGVRSYLDIGKGSRIEPLEVRPSPKGCRLVPQDRAPGTIQASQGVDGTRYTGALEALEG